MSVSFSALGPIGLYEFSKCHECGAVVVDVERHIHVAWHEAVAARLNAERDERERQIRTIWSHMPDEGAS